MKQFENKTALILGGTSGIGYETAQHLLNNGATVHVVGRNIDIIENQDNLVKHKVDITNQSQVEALSDKIAQLDNLDYLVNASGIFGPKSFLDHTKDDYDSYLDLNRGFFFTTQASAKK